MLLADKPPLKEAFLAHISMRPWSEYSKADYTPEQWHRACLIHQHQGAPTSKDQCKIPVRTPNGALNQNGVHAAAAALAGARGGVDASDEEKASARTALARLYSELGEDAPPSIVKHSDMGQEERLVHFGVKGMKWGVRHKRPDEQQRANRFGPKAKKIAFATVAIVGAAAVGYVLYKRGGLKMSAGGLTDPKSPLYSTMTAGKKAATTTLKKPVSLKDAPSPQAMMAQARNAGIRNELFKQGNRNLTDATWRSSAGLASEARKMGAAPKMPSIDEVRRKLADPSFIWDL